MKQALRNNYVCVFVKKKMKRCIYHLPSQFRPLPNWHVHEQEVLSSEPEPIFGTEHVFRQSGTRMQNIVKSNIATNGQFLSVNHDRL